MTAQEPEPISGYLQRRGKKKILSLWRRFFCVLNGRLLLFYKSESEYHQLVPYHDNIDLGLVYDVNAAPGLDFGIIVSTHIGPVFLRTRDSESHIKWLEALQAAVVIRDQQQVTPIVKITTTDQDISPPIPDDSKTPPKQPVVSFAASNVSDGAKNPKLGSKLFRLSLDIIPGYKYSTYDGARKLHGYHSTESVARSHQSSDTNVHIEDTAQSNEPKSPVTVKKRTNISKGNRPMSGSVSDFLLMGTECRTKSENKDNDNRRSLAVVTNKEAPVRKKISHTNPRLPTSSVVGKFLSFVSDGKMVGQEANEPQNETKIEKEDDDQVAPIRKSPSPVVIRDKQKKETAHQSAEDRKSSNAILNDSEDITTECKTDNTSAKPLECQATAEIQSEKHLIDSGSNKQPEDKDKKPMSRRKSSLVMLKNFFFPAKPSRTQAKEVPNQPNDCQQKATSRSGSVEPAPKPSALPEINSQKLPTITSQLSEIHSEPDKDEQEIDEDNKSLSKADTQITVQVICHQPATEKDQEFENQDGQRKSDDYSQNDQQEIEKEEVKKGVTRQESNLSQQSGMTVIEEPFVVIKAAEYDKAMVLEIIEPESESSGSREMIDTEKVAQVSSSKDFESNESCDPQASDNSASLLAAVASWLQQSPDLINRRSTSSCHSFDGIEFSSKHFSQPDLRPPALPIKIRSRCIPSPPYDVPRPISEPCFAHFNFSPPESDQLQSNEPDAESQIEESHADSLEYQEQEASQDSATASAEPSNSVEINVPQETTCEDQQSPKAECEKQKTKEQEVVSSKTRSEGRISHLVNFFSNASPEKPNEVHLRQGTKSRNSDLQRISFAANEMEMVEEETVNEF